MIRELPSFEHTFDIDIVGDQTGKRFSGTFTYIRPNIKNLGEISRYKARLDGDFANLDPVMSALHSMLSRLRFTLKEYPKWWETTGFGLELYDSNVVMELYKCTMEFEETFEKKVEEEANPKKNEK
jgi:hypothetical protein